MKKIFLSLSCGIACISLFSCKQNIIVGSGKEATQSRTTGTYSAIEVSAPVNVTITITPGAQPSLELTGYENVMQYIKTNVESNTLRIYTPQGTDFQLGKKVKANITVPSLESLSLSGANDGIVHGTVAGKSFKIDISGACNVTADNISVSQLEANLSGTGKIQINAGQVEKASYDISGAGSIRAFGLQSTETVATVSGVGDCDVNAQRKLDAHISGAGHIRYKGHPVTTTDASGVGTVQDAN